MLERGINYYTEELVLTFNGGKFFNDETNEIIEVKPTSIRLKHSLISVSKWESKWKKSFLDGEKNIEETIDYIKMMNLNQNTDDNVYRLLTNDDIQLVNQYISDSMTATTFKDEKNNTGRKKITTAEIIYYWMTEFNIPQEYQKWHLNRLLALIKVCIIKSTPPKSRKKMSASDRKAENLRRRKSMNSAG